MYDIDKVYGFYYNFTKVPPASLINEFIEIESDSNLDMIQELFPDATLAEAIRNVLNSNEIETQTEDGTIVDSNPYAQWKTWLNTKLSALGKVKFALDFPRDNTKRGRHNQMMDLMKSVLSSKYSATHMLKGSGFDELKGIRDEMVFDMDRAGILEKKSQLIPNLPQTHSNISNRMLVGKALIGPLANINSIIALYQQAKKLAVPFPFYFNGTGYTDLNKQVVDDNYVSHNIAQWVAAIVDNGKDPIAGDLNINWATLDVMITMLALGIDMRTTLEFINQEEIRTYAKLVAQFGGNKAKAVETMGVNVFSLMMKGPENHEFTNFTAGTGYKNKVFKDFLFYNAMAGNLADLTGAMKIAEGGPGPSTGSMEFKIRKYNGVMTSESKFLPLGAKDILSDPRFVHSELHNVLLSARENIGRVTVDPSKGIYKMVLDTLENIKGNLLTAAEIDDIIQGLGTYLMSSEIKITPELLKTFPKELIQFKNNEENKDYEFLFEGFYIENGILGHRNRASQVGNSDEIKTGLMEALIIEHPEFARKLGEYAFAHDGFGVSYLGFSQLLTASWYETFYPFQINGKALETASHEHSERFIVQYVQNNYRSLYNIVPGQGSWPKYIIESGAKDAVPMVDIDKLSDEDPIMFIRFRGKLYMKDEVDLTYSQVPELGRYISKGKNVRGKVFQIYNFEGNEFNMMDAQMQIMEDIPPMPDISDMGPADETLIDDAYDPLEISQRAVMEEDFYQEFPEFTQEDIQASERAAEQYSLEQAVKQADKLDSTNLDNCS